MYYTFWFCLYFLLVARATNTTTDNPSTLSITVVLSLNFSFHAFSTIQFESGSHPCLNRVHYVFLAIKPHIRKVTHSYKHVKPMGVPIVDPLRDVRINLATRLLNLSLINIRFIRNRSVTFADFINSNKSDIIVVTETWLQSVDSNNFIASVTPPGYKCSHAVVSGSLSVMILISMSYFNHVSISLSPHLFTYPWAMPSTLFFTLCTGLLMFPKPNSLRISVSLLRAQRYHVVNISGYLNLHLDKQDGWSQKFNDSLCQYNFNQIIDSPTHIHCHILYVVCVRGTFSKVVCPKISGGCLNILPSHFWSIYRSRHPANSARLIHRKSTR